jgi:hypothetical protein
MGYSCRISRAGKLPSVFIVALAALTPYNRLERNLRLLDKGKPASQKTLRFTAWTSTRSLATVAELNRLAQAEDVKIARIGNLLRVLSAVWLILLLRNKLFLYGPYTETFSASSISLWTKNTTLKTEETHFCSLSNFQPNLPDTTSRSRWRIEEDLSLATIGSVVLSWEPLLNALALTSSISA